MVHNLRIGRSTFWLSAPPVEVLILHSKLLLMGKLVTCIMAPIMSVWMCKSMTMCTSFFYFFLFFYFIVFVCAVAIVDSSVEAGNVDFPIRTCTVPHRMVSCCFASSYCRVKGIQRLCKCCVFTQKKKKKVLILHFKMWDKRKPRARRCTILSQVDNILTRGTHP